jgi:hypothetical protein
MMNNGELVSPSAEREMPMQPEMGMGAPPPMPPEMGMGAPPQ